MPTDIVDVLIDGRYLVTVDLNDIDTYYAFKDDAKRLELIANQPIVDLNDIGTYKDDAKRLGLTANQMGINLVGKTLTFAINVTRPRNLAPARIRWKYRDANGVVHTTNIFDTEPVRLSFYNTLSKKHPEYKTLLPPDFNLKKNRKLI